MESLMRRVGKAAGTDATVLLRGETGTGKGLIARAIHYNSDRADGPFVSVDCASLPAALIESELFGHERGAFTGAHSRAIGRFEAADGGTVFLDEVGELPLALQGRLLRVLQERCFERVGGRRTVEVDIRLVAATHRDLEDMVARGRFREDLYYRLRVVPLEAPPLRERGSDDLEMLAHHFVRLYAGRHRRGKLALSAEALATLHRHAWPGNVRELENCIESAVVLTEGPTIEPGDLPLPRRPNLEAAPGESLATLTWAQMQRRYIDAVLEAHGGNQSAAARAMGIGRSTLIRKLRDG
jgi:Nif-specific regulatory protein